MTRVSIITPAYNTKVYDFYRSLESINNQGNKNFEWIIVDDGSTDDLGFPVSIGTEYNYGPSIARNLGFQISSGDIITYLDMGDELYPDRVENLIKMFDKYNIEFLFSAYDIDSGEESLTRFDHFNWLGRSSRFPTAFEYIQLLKYQNISVPLGVAHTRRPFVEVGGFQRGIVCGEDGILWRRMANVIDPNRILFSDDAAGIYYVSQDGQSRTQRRFEMGGFAIDGDLKDNGRYLDEHWFNNFSSEGYYEQKA